MSAKQKGGARTPRGFDIAASMEAVRRQLVQTEVKEKRAAKKIDLSVAVMHLEQALVQARMAQSAGPNNPKRQSLVEANGHAVAASAILTNLKGATPHDM